jgi:hypothetical protein
VQIPAGVTRIRLELPHNSIIEGVAVYRNVKLNVTEAGSLYSTNDSTTECDVDLAAPLPFKPSTLPLRSIGKVPSVFSGDFKDGDTVLWDTPTTLADVGVIQIGGAWETMNWL